MSFYRMGPSGTASDPPAGGTHRVQASHGASQVNSSRGGDPHCIAGNDQTFAQPSRCLAECSDPPSWLCESSPQGSPHVCCTVTDNLGTERVLLERTLEPKVCRVGPDGHLLPQVPQVLPHPHGCPNTLSLLFLQPPPIPREKQQAYLLGFAFLCHHFLRGREEGGGERRKNARSEQKSLFKSRLMRECS